MSGSVFFFSLSLSLFPSPLYIYTSNHKHAGAQSFKFHWKSILGFSCHGCFSSTRWQPARNLNKPLLSPMPLLDELFVETHIIVPMENCVIFHVFPHEIYNAWWWRCTAVKRNCTCWAWLGSLYPIGSYSPTVLITWNLKRLSIGWWFQIFANGKWLEITISVH